MRWACIGFGNVGQAIVHKSTESGFLPQQVVVRNTKKITGYQNKFPDIQFINSINQLQDGLDLVILCVPDNVIPEVAHSLFLKTSEPTIAHTSGAFPLEDLLKYTPKAGVVYPLQTFSVDFQPEWSTIPVLIEASALSLEIIMRFAQQLISNPLWVSSVDRAVIHLGAVWTSNFVNLMAWIAQEIVSSTSHSYQLYLPLMQQVVEKLSNLTPAQAQTGPAKRNDIATIQHHINLLSAKNPELVPLYQNLSQQIQKRTVHAPLNFDTN